MTVASENKRPIHGTWLGWATFRYMMSWKPEKWPLEVFDDLVLRTQLQAPGPPGIGRHSGLWTKSAETGGVGITNMTLQGCIRDRQSALANSLVRAWQNGLTGKGACRQAG